MYFEVNAQALLALKSVGMYPLVNTTPALDILHHKIHNCSFFSAVNVSLTDSLDCYNICCTNICAVNASFYNLYVDPMTCENASFITKTWMNNCSIQSLEILNNVSCVYINNINSSIQNISLSYWPLSTL